MSSDAATDALDRPHIDVVDVPERRRFEARIGTEVAGISQYRRRGERVIFTHTEVSPAFEGKGVGSALAKGALDAVRAAGGVVEPLCPFIAAWIRRHPAYQDLVVASPGRLAGGEPAAEATGG
jgi:predicted GNAT family acetyltransferase